MRYGKTESLFILGVFDSGSLVLIDIYELSNNNNKIVDSAPCSEVGTTGVFKYEFSKAVAQKEEFLWIMSNGNYSKYGKIVLSGYMDIINDEIAQHRILAESQIGANQDLINELLDIEQGNWLIQNNQMIFYKRDGEELMRFNLFDSSGNPSETIVYRRDKV